MQRSALETRLNGQQKAWLTDHLVERWGTLYRNCGAWRSEMKVCEDRMDEDYSDREGETDEMNPDIPQVFSRQNESLGVVAGFVDFSYAQAKDDIFGGDEWLSASPVGSADHRLAAQIRRHAPWKLEQSNLLAEAKDALRLAPGLGTAFLKVFWQEVTEDYESEEQILVNKTTGEPILGPGGEYITSRISEPDPETGFVSPVDHPEIELPPEDIDWKSFFVSETAVVKSGIGASILDYNDVAFDLTAPEFDLLHTPFFHRFKRGLLDVRNEFGLDKRTYEALRDAEGESGAATPRENRHEEAGPASDHDETDRANREIVLVEGYIRCDPFGTGRPLRIWAVFAPDQHLLVRADYLPNRTPEGRLPVFPVRWWRTPNRITGKGYHSVFKKDGDFIDKMYSAIAWRTRHGHMPITGFHRSSLDSDLVDLDGVFDIDKPLPLADGKSLDDLLQFKDLPDVPNGARELLEARIQMTQLRTGISSAAQGELKGLPQSNTATGVNSIISRGATLLKWPIEDAREDLLTAVEYAVMLLYARQDQDETFAWGEGDARELIELKADDVRSLRFDVQFALSQTQTQERIQNALTAKDLVLSYYLEFPPEIQPRIRPLFVDILNDLGFRNAESVIAEMQPPPAAAHMDGGAAPVPPSAEPPSPETS